MNNVTPPPSELCSARVLAYAVIDAEVTFTGRAEVYVDGKLLGSTPRVVLAQEFAEPHEYLLFYCTEDWEVLGAGGFAARPRAEAYAEARFQGISKKWQHVA